MADPTRPPLRLIFGRHPDGTLHCIVDFKAQAGWKSHEDADEAWGGDGVVTKDLVSPDLEGNAASILGVLHGAFARQGADAVNDFAGLLSRIAKASYEAGKREDEPLQAKIERFLDDARRP